MYLIFALIVDRFACVNPFVINVDWLCQIFILQMKLKINITHTYRETAFFYESTTISVLKGARIVNDQHIQCYIGHKISCVGLGKVNADR